MSLNFLNCRNIVFSQLTIIETRIQQAANFEEIQKFFWYAISGYSANDNVIYLYMKQLIII